MSVLTIVAGTSGVSAVLHGEGHVLAEAHEELAQHVPEPGRVEHAPEEIWQATLHVTREVLTEVDAGDITSVGIVNLTDTVVLWDRETLGSPRPAIAGHDRRTTDICTRLRDQGHGERVSELTGHPLDPRFPATKLTWLAEHEPHAWALVRSGRYAVGTVDSYLIARMTRGTWHVTDVSNASRTLLLDRRARDWSDELCRLFDVPRDALPDLVPSEVEVARTEPSVFLRLSLPIVERSRAARSR